MILVHSADSGELTADRTPKGSLGLLLSLFFSVFWMHLEVLWLTENIVTEEALVHETPSRCGHLPPEPAQCTKIKVALLKSQITFTYSVPKLFSRYFTKNSKPSEMFLTVLYFACFEHHRMT